MFYNIDPLLFVQDGGSIFGTLGQSERDSLPTTATTTAATTAAATTAAAKTATTTAATAATTATTATTAAGMAHKKVSEFGSLLLYQLYLPTSVTRKNRQMSIKWPKNDFTRKMIDFDIFTKIP